MTTFIKRFSLSTLIVLSLIGMTTISAQAAGKKLPQAAQDRVLALIHKTNAKFINRMSNIEKFDKRIDSRIKKIEATGKNLSNAKARSEHIKTVLKDTRAMIAGVEAQAKISVASGDSQTAIKAQIQLFKDAKEKLKTLHADVVEILKDLNAASPAASTSTR